MIFIEYFESNFRIRVNVYFLNNNVVDFGIYLSRYFNKEYINSSLYNIRSYSYDLMWPFTTHARNLLKQKKMSADGKRALWHRSILADSARKRNRKEVLANYNKTRINIDHQQDRWTELKEALRVQTNAAWSISIRALRM
jgi:hypothetical protein